MKKLYASSEETRPGSGVIVQYNLEKLILKHSSEQQKVPFTFVSFNKKKKNILKTVPWKAKNVNTYLIVFKYVWISLLSYATPAEQNQN